MKLGKMVEAIDYRSLKPLDENLEISTIAYDSRRVESGSLFVAIPGERQNGVRFIPQAITQGAAAVITEDEVEFPGVPLLVVKSARRALSQASAALFERPAGRIPVIGITGTNGKTTTSYLVESILRAGGKNPGLIGTINYRLNQWTEASLHTTPESADLHRLLQKMVQEGAKSIVMEVSSHGIALYRVDDIDFEVVCFTNLTHDHLDFHGTLEDYFLVKRRLFTEILPRSSRTQPAAVINYDDPLGRRLIDEVIGRTVTFGLSNDADVSYSELVFTVEGIRGELRADSKRISIESPLLGSHNAANILAAAAIGLAMDIPDRFIAEGIGCVKSVPGRIEAVLQAPAPLVIVDYAHTPDALERVIVALRPLARGQLIAVFGCGGDRDTGKRPAMGEIAVTQSDRVIITSDNPRTEDPGEIVRQIVDGIPDSARELTREEWRDGREPGYLVEVDRATAIELALSAASEADLVLIAGKGHEDYQIVGTTRHSFDDRTVARATWNRLKGQACN